MFTKTGATVFAIACALAVPAEALSIGGSLGGRGKSTSSSSKSTSSSGTRSGGGISAGASVGRGGVSVGARAGRTGIGASVSRSGISASTSVGSAAGVDASVSRSGISTSTSVGGLSVGTSVSGSGISATVDGTGTADTAASASQEPQALNAVAPGTAAVLLLPLPQALQPGSSNRRCIRGGGCPVITARLQEGRASASDETIRTEPVAIGMTSRLVQEPGTPATIVRSCQLAAARAAQAYGAVSVEAASGGKFSATGKGGGIAPVNLRVTYPGSTGSRQARVACAITGDGTVPGLND
jgi:hypothetical protein